jgi:hypothetical protein
MLHCSKNHCHWVDSTESKSEITCDPGDHKCEEVFSVARRKQARQEFEPEVALVRTAYEERAEERAGEPTPVAGSNPFIGFIHS